MFSKFGEIIQIFTYPDPQLPETVLCVPYSSDKSGSPVCVTRFWLGAVT